MSDWDNEPDWWAEIEDRSVDAVYDCLLVSSMDSVLCRLSVAETRLLDDDHEMDCPGEAHVKDGCFNPSSQDCYGDGAHDCDLCENEGHITFAVYKEWAIDVKRHLKFLEARRIRLLEEAEQEKLVKAIMKLPQSNNPALDK